MQEKPVIGLLCDHNSAVLEGFIGKAGYRVLRRRPERLAQDAPDAVDAWVIDCEDSDAVADIALLLEPRVVALSNRPAPGELQPYRDWCERIIRVLDKWTADIRDNRSATASSEASAFTDVQGLWLLAGSTGAIEAARVFFGRLQPAPPVAFLYAQHINAAQQSTLTAIGLSNRDLACYVGVGRHWLNCGHILIAPASSKLGFARYGEVFSTREPWTTPETPNLDELMLTMSGMQPAPAGVIILSGAGRDGSRGLAALHSVGSEVWAQDPTTCAAPSMPVTAIESGLTSLVAPPEALASHLLARYGD